MYSEIIMINVMKFLNRKEAVASHLIRACNSNYSVLKQCFSFLIYSSCQFFFVVNGLGIP